jgi:hypothetical protein
VFDGGVKVSARPERLGGARAPHGRADPRGGAVLAEAGLIIPDEQEDEVEKFREFLDSISPEDFRGRRREGAREVRPGYRPSVLR